MEPSTLEAVGQTYQNFVITKYLPLNELNSSLVELVHEPTGARIVHIVNDDPENLFCLSFQTLPYNSNGIAHILEHTVLCGSEKFPVKDPFFAMTRRSLNTYMNALTGQDFTCYPASSQVEKDFYNLLEVYMDAAFHPELKKMSFLQEGHRLEFTDPKDPTSPLTYKGVVYNEMKGAMSSPDSRLWESLSKKLIPDLPYAHNSGGSPKEIPNLTHQELIDFHREFYHPSRCLFFFYGNLPLVKHLNQIEKELAKSSKLAPLPPLPKQPRFDSPVIAEDRYPVLESEGHKSHLAFAWLTTQIADQEEILALSILESILTDTDASPLTLALLKSGLCSQVDSSLDVEMSEIPWIITCKDCDANDADAIQKVLFDTLKKVNFTEEETEAALHQLEIERMEIGAEGVPFGLSLFMRAVLIKQHGTDAENGLLIHSLFSSLRARLKDPNYLKGILNKWVIENPHFVRLTMKPDPHLAQTEEDEEKNRLKKIESTLSDREKKLIIEESALLKEYQESIEHQSLECLPKVTLKDIPPHARSFSLEAKSNVYHHACFTNQILYADLIFDLPKLEKEELSLLSLLTKMLPELGAADRSYEENLAYQQRYIGSLDPVLSLNIQHDDPDQCRPTLSIRGKALYQNGDKLFSLFEDTVNHPNFQSKERIQEWLVQHASELKENLTRSSMRYAIQASLSPFSCSSFVYEEWHGLPYYQKVQKWAKKVDAAFISSLENLAKKVLGLKDYQLVVGCDQSYYQELEKTGFYSFKMPNRDYLPWDGKMSLPQAKSHAHLISAPVAFTSLGMRTISYLESDAPYLSIATELMENLILHKEIREKGGAYGSGATYTPATGNFNFYSYRDPHLNNTLDAFHLAVKAIGNQEFNERELEEAKLGVLQTLDAPVPPGNRALLAYTWEKTGRTLKLREAFRTQVLSATSEEIAGAVKRRLSPFEGNLVTFLGKEIFAKEGERLGFPLTVLPI